MHGVRTCIVLLYRLSRIRTCSLEQKAFPTLFFLLIAKDDADVKRRHLFGGKN